MRDLSKEISENSDLNNWICTPECRESVRGTEALEQQLSNYYNALRVLAGIMFVLMFIELIIVCISCRLWRRKFTAVTTTTQPEVVLAQVVAVDPMAVDPVAVDPVALEPVALEPVCPKTEGP